MHHKRNSRILIALSLCILSATLVRAQRVDTRVDSAQVVYVEGNALVLRLTNGEVRQFDLQDSARFGVQGKSVAKRDLAPGMKVSATISTAIAPRWVDAVEIVDVGTVWKISGNNLIVKTPAGENKMYLVPAGGTITLEGKTIALAQLQEGDKITATVLRTRPAPGAPLASKPVLKAATTPPMVGPLLIDEGVVQEASPGLWGIYGIYFLIAGGLVLLAVILMLFRHKRKV